MPDKLSAVLFPVALVSVVGLVVASRALAIVSPGDYVNWPQIDYAKQTDRHATIRKALEQLVLKENLREPDNVQLVLGRVESASKNDSYGGLERAALWNIHSLVTDDNGCGQNEIDLTKSLAVQLMNEKLPRQLGATLEHVCKMSTWRCSLKRDSRRWLIDAKMASQLDEAFAAALVEPGKHKGDKKDELGHSLAKRLQSFDLADSEFNAKKMLSVMKRIDKSKGRDQKLRKPLELMREFMQTRCAEFEQGLKVAIETLDLVRSYGHKFVSWTDPTLDRMDEYQRLCRALSLPERQESISANLEKQLAKERLNDKLARKVSEWVWD